MKITITTQILDGNLGDGWNDNYEAANGLANYIEAIWMKDLAEIIAEGHEVNINIDVQYNTSGCSRNLDVWVDSNDDSGYDLVERVWNTLTDENRIWEQFCASEEATKYFEEV